MATVKIKRKATKRQDPFLVSGKVPSYRDVAELANYMRDRGGISSRFYTGVAASTQRKLGVAIKRARFLGLLPYINTVK